jgi:hypothetical protein
MTATHKGGCNCGALRYEFTGEPQVVVACHCLNCQRQGGGEFSVNLLLADDQFTLAGQAKVYTDNDSESGRPVLRHFCGNCGSPIISTSESVPGMSILKAGTLDERTGFAPQMQCWTDTAFDWGRNLMKDIPSSERNPTM